MKHFLILEFPLKKLFWGLDKLIAGLSEEEKAILQYTMIWGIILFMPFISVIMDVITQIYEWFYWL